MAKSRELYRDFRDKMLLSRELQLRLIQIVLGCVATLTDGVIIIISNQTSSVVKAGPGRAHAQPKHHGLAYSRCPPNTSDLATPLM